MWKKLKVQMCLPLNKRMFLKRAIKEEKIATSAFVGHLHRLHRRIYKDSMQQS